MSQNQPFFTIIVPHHRTEPFLEQNLNSIKNQKFTNFECLVINDGSPGVELDKFSNGQDPEFFHTVDLKGVPLKDQTQKIFNSLVGNDPRFKLFYKEQGGTADARNYAFTKMTGKYVLCVDADDWILEDHLQNYYDAFEKLQDKKYPIVCNLVMKFYNIEENKQITPISTPAKITLANLIYAPRLIEWNFAQSTDIIKKYGLKSDPRLGPGPAREDKIIKHGFDDLSFAWAFVESVQKEVGKENLFFYDIHKDTYMYRDLNSFKKNQLKGDKVYAIYGKYLAQKASKNQDWQVKLSAMLSPAYLDCFEDKNFFKRVILKRGIGFFLKLFTNYYF